MQKKKLRVLETVVFPTALYGCEAWTINNTDAKRITSFEMKCYRKILRISWMEKVTNKEVLSRLDMKTTMLLQKAKSLKLKYFGHIKRHETLERHILDGYDNHSGRKTVRRSYTFPSKGSRSNVSPRDKLINNNYENGKKILRL